MALNVNYLGLELKNPVIISSSPHTASVERILTLERHGAAAVVLKSVFEEELIGEAAFLERYNDYPEAADYLNTYIAGSYLAGHLNMIAEIKNKVGIPVIASINCSSAGTWIDYAESVERAGADALELNIFLMPGDAGTPSEAIEERYLKIIGAVASRVRIPVTVKLGMRFTNIMSMCARIYNFGAGGVVMFNRFFEPDVDVDTISLTTGESLSHNSELLKNLRWIALCSSEVPAIDIAANTGVHTGEDAVKALLTGAKAVQICSTIYMNGVEVIGQITDYMEEWMSKHNFGKVSDFSGLLNYRESGDAQLLHRAQYMKFFPKSR